MSVKWIFATLLLAIMAGGCAKKETQQAAPPEVSVVIARADDLPVFAEYVGQAYGLSDVAVKARVQGLITGMYFTEGSYVKEGSLLYTIDDLPYQAKLSEADGRVADAKTEVVRSKSDLARIEPLAASNALSQRDLDAARAAVGAAEGRLQAASASRRNAEIELGYCRVTAPISGYIGISSLRVGDFAGGFDSKTLNTISELGKMRIRFPIGENDYLAFLERIKKRGADSASARSKVPVDIYLSNGQKYQYPGYFSAIDRQIDPTTGSLILEVITENPEGELKPGQYIRVKFPADMMMGAVSVPQRAVIQIQNMYQVFTLADSNKVQVKMVKTGPRVGERWVITEGLKEGDKVLIVGNRAIKPNTVITPVMVQDSAELIK